MKSKFIYVLLLLFCSYAPGNVKRCPAVATSADRPCKEKAVPALQRGFSVSSNEGAVFSPVMHAVNNI